MIRESANKGIRGCFCIGEYRIVVMMLLVVWAAAGSCYGVFTDSSAKPRYFKKDYVAEAKKSLMSLDAAMGDWEGGWKLDDGTDSGPLAAQVIALGDGKYRVNVLDRFDARDAELGVLDGQREGQAVKLVGKATSQGMTFDVKGTISGQKLAGTFENWEATGTFEMKPVFRVSKTMGLRPPKGAVVLFNGKKSKLKEWKRARVKANEDDVVKWELIGGAMRVKRPTGSIITRKKFTDVDLHLEFRTPFMPAARGQGRGNSGVYLQGKYEVQVLDSYGLDGKDNECGGIYKVREPSVNMCAPPGQWQTYDIEFRAPRFDSSGKKVSDGTMTVWHNGVMIQNKTKMKGATTASLGGEPSEPAGIYLQDHGNAVEYRNIWLIEKK